MNRKCQVFTPVNYVEELLDSVGYKKDLYGKKILENSCGDGKILESIVKRYIDDCKRKGLSITKIKSGLEKDIYGVEIDPKQFEECISNLDNIVKDHKIKLVKWNVMNTDYLKYKDEREYQFIVGNPPYITYKELEKEEQEYLRKEYESCEKGKFDYCYAFIEKSINSLAKDGKISYLIPSSIFKTVFGSKLRECMKPYIETIRDYTQEKVFDEALVKSAIMVLNKDRKTNKLCYVDVTLGKNLSIYIDDLGKKWFFTNNKENGSKRFGDYFKVSHVVATLLNEAYVLAEEDYTERDKYYICRGYDVEKEVVRDTATPRSLRYGNKERIIFPYYYDENGRLERYSEKEFELKFPGAAGYLREYKEQLDERKSDSGAKWFEYGRSQALININREKLLVSTVFTSKVAVYRLSKECIPYAGMYIIEKSNNKKMTLEKAKDILESRNFMQYVLDIGIHISGSSLRITSKDIEDYKF